MRKILFALLDFPLYFLKAFFCLFRQSISELLFIMGIIADLAAFCSDLVTPCFVDSIHLLCYTIDIIVDAGLNFYVRATLRLWHSKCPSDTDVLKISSLPKRGTL